MADGKEIPAADLTEEMKQKVAAAVNKDLHDYQKNFVERSIQHMQQIATIAPEVAKTTKAVYDAFMKAGFDENRSFALAMEMVKGRGIVGY